MRADERTQPVRADAGGAVRGGASSRRTRGRGGAGGKQRWKGSTSLLAAWTVSIVVGVVGWFLASQWLGSTVVASPVDTVSALGQLQSKGLLVSSIVASMRRILSGWAIGLVIGAPIGILMGRSKLLRDLLDPYVEFFRFIPAIAFVTLTIVWFGIGETSKIVLIVYTSTFIVIISTSSATASIAQNKLLAAKSLGAGRWQLARTVVLPSAVPGIVTGARLALGNSFLTIISAEIVAADHGLGALIWSAYNYGRMDWIFAGILVLGVLGFISDRIVRIAASGLLGKYGVK